MSFQTSNQTRLSDLDGCSAANSKYGSGYGCNGDTKVRRLMIWAENQGNLTLSGPGYDAVEPSLATGGANAGILEYYGGNESKSWKYRGGYGSWLIVGETYTVSDIIWSGDMHFTFSGGFSKKKSVF